MQLGELFAVTMETRERLGLFKDRIEKNFCKNVQCSPPCPAAPNTDSWIEQKLCGKVQCSPCEGLKSADEKGASLAQIYKELGQFETMAGALLGNSTCPPYGSSGLSEIVAGGLKWQEIFPASAKCDATAGTKKQKQPDPEVVQELTAQASELATRMKAASFYWAHYLTAQDLSGKVRMQIIRYVNLLSEFSNQISARTDSLFKQAVNGTKATDLPLSVHLRDSGPTDFLHLFEWYKVRAETGGNVLCDAANSDEPHCYKPGQPLDVLAQVRLAKRLFADHYWTKINEVYASGQGDVRMALIKDDIGNWNLKSFDNDPSKLLDAYRQANLASIKLGERLARKVVEEGSTAGALTVLGQLAEGRFGGEPRLGTRDLDVVHQDTLSELKALLNKVRESDGEIANNCTDRPEDAEEVSIHKAVDTAREALDKAKKKLAAKAEPQSDSEAENGGTSGPGDGTPPFPSSNKTEGKKEVSIPALEKNLQDLEEKQTACRKAAQEYHAEARQIITNHRRVLEVLQKLQPVEPAPASKAGSNAATTATEAARGANAQ